MLRRAHQPPVRERDERDRCPRLGFGARVSGSVLWVSQLDGGPLRNYCADPKTGRVLATIPLKADEGILTTGSKEVYLFDVASTGQDGEILTEMSVPSKCAPS